MNDACSFFLTLCASFHWRKKLRRAVGKMHWAEVLSRRLGRRREKAWTWWWWWLLELSFSLSLILPTFIRLWERGAPLENEIFYSSGLNCFSLSDDEDDRRTYGIGNALSSCRWWWWWCNLLYFWKPCPSGEIPPPPHTHSRSVSTILCEARRRFFLSLSPGVAPPYIK